jgi:hypothetical protein
MRATHGSTAGELKNSISGNRNTYFVKPTDNLFGTFSTTRS